MVPVELAAMLERDGEARAFFESIAPGYQRRYCEWIAGPKDPATRLSHAGWVLTLLQKKQKALKIDSYMGDVGIIKKIDDIPELRAELIALSIDKSHQDVSRYGLLLADHVLKMTDTPVDEGIKAVFDVNRRWQAGSATFQDGRDVAGTMFDRARSARSIAEAKLYRVLGQVAAIPHVKRHALIASDYDITLINVLYPQDMEAVRAERLSQIEMMKSV